MELSLINLSERFPDEDTCIDYLVEKRWHGKPICMHCGSYAVYVCKSRRLFKCKDCSKQFTVRIGTIFEESRLPLRKWFLATYLLTSHKKGVSSIQMAKHLQITQKSSWFLLHRIRQAMLETGGDLFNGVVEVDETYIGGVEKGKGMSSLNRKSKKAT